MRAEKSMMSAMRSASYDLVYFLVTRLDWKKMPPRQKRDHQQEQIQAQGPATLFDRESKYDR